MNGPRRALPRLHQRAYTAFHDDGTVTRVMQSQQRCTPRVTVTLRVAIDGESVEQASRLSVEELEAIVRAANDMIGGYELLAREQAAGQGRQGKKT